ADPEPVVNVVRALGVRRAFEELLPQVSVAPGTSEEIVERLLAHANPNDVETVSAIWRAATATDVAPLAAAVAVPALVVSGALDATCPTEMGRELALALGTRLVVLPGIGHLPMFEAPAATADLINGFFAQLAEGPAALAGRGPVR